jgi:hypothetical protein
MMLICLFSLLLLLLGFTTLFQANTSLVGDPVDIYTKPYGPSPFDAHLVFGNDQTALIYLDSTQAQRQADVTSNNVNFFLDDVTPTQFVPILAPNPWDQGASLAHYIEPDSSNTLMNSSVTAGVRIRYPGTIALRMLRAIGYTLQPSALTPGSTTAPGATTVPGSTTADQGTTDQPTQDPNNSAGSTFSAVTALLLVTIVVLLTL